MSWKAEHQMHDLMFASADFGTSIRNSRHHHPRVSSKTSKDKAVAAVAGVVPPQSTNQTSLKFRDAKNEPKCVPLHTYLSSELGRSGQIGGNNQQNNQAVGSRDAVYIDGELIGHMSSLPGYLQRGDNPTQDKALSFGVLDWDRLEKWKHKQTRISSHSAATTSASSSAPAAECTNTHPIPNKVKPTQGSTTGSRRKQPPAAGDPGGNNGTRKVVENSSQIAEKVSSTARDSSKHRRSRLGEQQPAAAARFVEHNNKSLTGTGSDVNRKKDERMRQSLKMESLSSSTNLTSNGAPTSKFHAAAAAAASLVDKPKPEEMQVMNELMSGLDHDSVPGHQRHHHSKQDSVFLLPKDFSKSDWLDGKSQRRGVSSDSELNGFSDMFLIEEFHLEEPVIPFMAKTETDLDLINLENSSSANAQRTTPFPPPDQPSLSDLFKHNKDEAKVEHDNDHPIESRGPMTTTTSLETSPILCRKSSEMKASNTRDTRSFDMGRVTRSFSFKESSEAAALPRLSYSTTKSGPAATKPPPVARRSSPLRRLLDPLLKSRASRKQQSCSDVELKSSLVFKTIDAAAAAAGENGRAAGGWSSRTVKAVLYLTVNNGVPVFKFLVESKNEILACSVKRLNPIKSDDPSWLYSFSTVNKTKRRSSGSWKYHGGGSKGKASSELSYTVIGQLKVHEPLCGEIRDKRFTVTTSEAVLYGVDLSKVDTGDSEYMMTNKELGAIVIQNSAACISKEDNSEDIITGHIVAILPGGIHTIPNEGGPSSLINRWRTGGKCDCGGWDEGCKLQILSNINLQEEEFKISTGAYSDRQHDCSLFLQGSGSSSGSKQSNQPVFSLTANGDGAVYSVEYHDGISSLQAFAIAVAVLSSRDEPNDMLNSTTYRHNNEMPKVHVRSKSAVFLGEGTARFATNPPHSPVGRA